MPDSLTACGRRCSRPQSIWTHDLDAVQRAGRGWRRPVRFWTP